MRPFLLLFDSPRCSLLGILSHTLNFLLLTSLLFLSSMSMNSLSVSSLLRFENGYSRFSPVTSNNAVMSQFSTSQCANCLLLPIFNLSIQNNLVRLPLLILLLKSCFLSLVENIGFEPMTPCLQSRCSSQLS